jgi:hypothetical protein
MACRRFAMGSLLDKAFEEAAKLSTEEQEAFARWVLDELASERRWREKFSSSGDQLSRMAREALSEHREGRTKDLDPDAL